MSQVKNKQLVDRLLDRTIKGKIDWKEAPNEAFQVSLANNSIRLEEVRSPRARIFLVSLLNALGDVADAFNDEELDQADSESTYFLKLKELYSLAQRQARSADKVLDELLSELDDDIPF